ncbi:hypothetical protein LL946_01280 [Knoellia locipacati]|uniref:hypothetical protein n=1 Tax=Knoellia locipacati TaxID=882824 RepID=UPI00384CF0ED
MAPSSTTHSSTPGHRRGSTTSRRAAGVLATATLASLVTVTPAFARLDPGDRVSAGTSTSRPDGSTLQNPIPSPGAQMSPKAPAPGPAAITIDDGAVGYLQIGLGALAGMAAVGGLVVASTRRRHAHTAA